VNGASVSFTLHHELHVSPASRRLCIVVHGALGSGRNLRGLVQTLASERPELGFVLVDLRAHGDSRGASPPHTLENAARDLAHLAVSLERRHPELPKIDTLIGHSLGGKVALEFARLALSALDQLWVLDSNPGRQEPEQIHEIHTVLRAAEAVPSPMTTRQSVIAALRRAGLSPGMAAWMGTNLRRDGAVLRWAFEAEAIQELLRDYCIRDLWPLLEAGVEPGRPAIHLVIGARSDRWSPEMRKRAEQIQPESGVFVHHLPDAGHWVHVDNPTGLIDLMSRYLVL
jgi:pimeloyl-ACP methyl ester carboxylesterase